LSPLTEPESELDDGAEAPNQLHPGFGEVLGPVKKKRKKGSAKSCHSKKRVKAAASGHRPHTYTAHLSTAAHHAEKLPLLCLPVDVASFPTSAPSSGSWVGKRSQDARKTPWTVPELLEENFRTIEWDGQCAALSNFLIKPYLFC